MLHFICGGGEGEGVWQQNNTLRRNSGKCWRIPLYGIFQGSHETMMSQIVQLDIQIQIESIFKFSLLLLIISDIINIIQSVRLNSRTLG